MTESLIRVLFSDKELLYLWMSDGFTLMKLGSIASFIDFSLWIRLYGALFWGNTVFMIEFGLKKLRFGEQTRLGIGEPTRINLGELHLGDNALIGDATRLGEMYPDFLQVGLT